MSSPRWYIDCCRLIDYRESIDDCQYMRSEIVAKPVKSVPGASCCPSVLDAPLPEHEASDLAAAFAALGDPIRLRLLSLVADAVEVCSCNLEGPLGRSQPTISHH